MPVSVLIPARNESLNIEAATESVKWADEVWVIDSQSTDRTQELAESAGAKVVQFDYSGTGPKKKNWALEHVPFRNDWVLILDADERATPALSDEISSAVARKDVDGFFVDRDYIFMGKSLSCFRPNWNLRLFRHRLGRYEQLATNAPFTGDNEVHEHIILNGRSGYLKNPLLHEDKRPLRAWVDNHNRYSEWEAMVYRQLRSEPVRLNDLRSSDVVWRRRALKRIWVRLPVRPAARFFAFYILRRGFLDGRQGLWYSMLMGYYEFLISMKSREVAGPEPSRTVSARGAEAIPLVREGPHA